MRRVIRIKAMQGLYTYFNNKAVNLSDAQQKVFDGLIEEPDFYNATPQEKTGFQALLPVLLNEAFEQQLVVADLPENQRWLGLLAQKAYVTWQNENKKERERIIAGLVHDLQSQLPLEISFWQIFLGLVEMVNTEEDRKQNRHLAQAPTPKHELKILSHPFLALLQAALHPEKGPQPIGLKPLETEEMARIFQAVFKDFAEYQTYKRSKEVTDEGQEEIFKMLYRKLYKCEAFNEIMQDRDLHWSENRILLEVSLKASFKLLASGQPLNLVPNKEEIEEYQHFFQTLLNSSIDAFEEDNALIENNLKNWEPDRVALLDKYLIHLSINEMRNFPHIPVKVTINEYLEIAKAYSTPGSAGFINGVVDKLASMLKQGGSIKKSARGLMDNK